MQRKLFSCRRNFKQCKLSILKCSFGTKLFISLRFFTGWFPSFFLTRNKLLKNWCVVCRTFLTVLHLLKSPDFFKMFICKVFSVVMADLGMISCSLQPLTIFYSWVYMSHFLMNPLCFYYVLNAPKMNLHSVIVWISRTSLLKTGTITEI